MPTLTIEQITLHDGSLSLRCPQFPGWRGPKKDRDDRAAVEAHLKARQSRHTEFLWLVAPSAGDLEHLGFTPGALDE